MLHKLRKIVVAVGTAAMLFGTMGAIGASASTTATVLTRAQFVYDFAVANNLAPVYPTTPTFSDVPASSPYYGYIEAAYQAGWILGVGNGDFAPNSPLTRAQVVKIEVIALGDGPAALADMSSATTFTDNSTIPSWARGYVVEAVKIGLVKGYPNGSFAPDQSLTTADEPFFLSQYKAAESSTVFTISGSPSDAGVGQAVTLSATGTTQTVTYSITSSTAAINGSTFIASAAGNYTVTGTTSGGATATTTVHVYGTATTLKISAPTTVVANGASQTTVTVSLLDANGNLVANDSDNITLQSSNNSAAGVLTSAGSVQTQATNVTVAAVNGVATFTIESGKVAGAQAVLTAGDAATGSTITAQTATVTTVAQKATAITVTGPSYVEENASTAASFSAQVVDQTGNPMLFGSFSLSESLSGPGSFSQFATTASASTGPTVISYTGNGHSGVNVAAATTPITVYSIQGATGAIALTVSGSGLTSGSATVSAVSVGAAAGIKLTAPSVTSFAQSSTSGITYTVQIVDTNGFPVATTETLDLSVLNSSGATATNIMYSVGGATATAVAANSTVLVPSAGTTTITLTNTGSAADAGSYTIQLSSATLSSSANESFSETAGAAANVDVTAAAQYVASANPSTTISAQLVDSYGNSVSEAGVPVSFTTTSAATLSASSVNTNANGVATITATAPAYAGDSYSITGQATINGALVAAVSTNTASFTVESTIATAVSVALKDTTGGTYSSGHSVGSQSIAESSDTVTFTVYANDQYGNPVNAANSLTVSFSGTGSFGATPTAVIGSAVSNGAGGYTVTTTSAGKAVFTATAELAGPVTVTVTDTSVAAAPAGSAAMNIVAGLAQGAAFFTTNGTDVGSNVTNAQPSGTPLTVTAGTAVQLTLKPVDFYGNPTVAGSGGLTVTLVNPATGSGDVGGTINTTASGVSAGTSVAFTAGESAVTLYYVNATAGSYNLDNQF